MLYTGGRSRRAASSLQVFREANFSAERPPPEAPARISSADADTRRARHPQAQAGEGSQAPLRLTGRELERRHRLSRARDFDAVYRRGRSVSTRYLVLYAFPREDGGEPRLGLAVSRKLGGAVTRNRLKRLLRASFDELRDAFAPGYDYVLVPRPGIAEPAETHGAPWVRDRVRDILRLSGGNRPQEARLPQSE